MAIEDQDTQVDNNIETTDETNEGSEQEVQYTEVEQRAIEQGWVPKDQWDGHGKWRDADEFLDRGELFAKIDEVKRHNKAMEGTVQALKRHLESVRKTEYSKALSALRAEKKEALANNDADAVIDIEDKIDTLKTEAFKEAQQSQVQSVPAPDPILAVWINRNPWYQSDKAMKVFADTIGEELAYKGITDPKELLIEVERRTKKEFAHKFNNPNRNKPGIVEGSARKSGPASENIELTPEETLVMKKFVKAGVMTEKEYKADIKAMREGK